LWRENQLVGLIDWEEMHIGSPLTDLAIARLDLFFAFDWQAVEDFTRNYLALNPINASQLPYWDLRCSQRIGDSYESWASSFPPLGRPDITADVLRSKQSEFIERALPLL
jgi:Ser/Thr protein kinase RdoA (MazF antagonist)